MKTRSYFLIFCVFFLFFITLYTSLHAQERKNPFVVSWDDSIQYLKAGEQFVFKVKFTVPPGHYLYADKTEVNLLQSDPLQLIETKTPPATQKFDSFSGKEEWVYLQDFEIIKVFQVPKEITEFKKTLEAEIRYQGCSSDFCYRPNKQSALVPLRGSLKSEIPPANQTQKNEIKSESTPILSKSFSSLMQLLQEAKVEQLLKLNPILLLLLVFVAGILTDFTPCVLPVVPLTLAAIGAKKDRAFLHNMGVSTALVFGISTSFALLGLLTSALGLSFGFLFQSKYFLVFLVFFFIVMSLGLLGVIPFGMPQKLQNFFGHMGGQGYKGAFAAGFSIGFIASPCVGPLMGPILLLVAKGQNLVWGATLLFVYGLGMGALFWWGGTFYATVGSKLRGGKYSNHFKKLLALTLLLPALYYSWILIKQPTGNTSSPVLWQHSYPQGLALAKEQHKPMLIDFYADWCLPCLEIDQQTFHHPEVIKKLEKDFVAVKIDCTQESPECVEATQKFEVIGFPTLLFFDAEGQLKPDLSVLGGFIGPEKMLEILNSLGHL